LRLRKNCTTEPFFVVGSRGKNKEWGHWVVLLLAFQSKRHHMIIWYKWLDQAMKLNEDLVNNHSMMNLWIINWSSGSVQLFSRIFFWIKYRKKNIKIRSGRNRIHAIYSADWHPLPLQPKKPYCFYKPIMLYIAILGNIMAPASPQRDLPQDLVLTHSFCYYT